jgi:hypothetical protein
MAHQLMKSRKSGRRSSTSFVIPNAEWLEKHIDAHPEIERHVRIWRRDYRRLWPQVVLALRHERFLNKTQAEEAAFHLLDWIANLQELVALFRSRQWDPESAQRVLISFLSHSPHHLTVAYKIVFSEPVTDVFNVGAVRGTGRFSKSRDYYGKASARTARRKS